MQVDCPGHLGIEYIADLEGIPQNDLGDLGQIGIIKIERVFAFLARW